MWLLSTDRAELHFFSDPANIQGGYAILSHTWTGKEQTFQDTRSLQQRCEVSKENPRDLSSDKVRNCCILAERDRYRWVWIDSCCIDKTSSTELSEAINSMFRWYSFAEVCYAFLEDVPSDCVLDQPGSAFRKSRWHTRGWTLQELIAPALVVFVAQDWTQIGTKKELAQLLNNITGIWVTVLNRKTSYLRSSVAVRMSWASRRHTTRIEDEAYCLLGLFNINMPTIYGEGRQAFQRLQQEIAKQSFDSSLFAWGSIYTANNEIRTPATIQKVWSDFHGVTQDFTCLLALSPRKFTTGTVYYTPMQSSPLQPYLPFRWKSQPEEPEDSERRTRGPFGTIELPTFEMTSYGMKCRFPVADIGEYSIAVLLCETSTQHVGLLLHPVPESSVQDPRQKKYYTGYAFLTASVNRFRSCRLVYLGNDLYNLRFKGTQIKPEWRTFYVQASPPFWENADPVLRLASFQLDSIPTTPFRVPRWLIGNLSTLGFLWTSSVVNFVQPDNLPQVTATFSNVPRSHSLRMWFGLCAADQGPPVHWAWLEMSYDQTWTRKWTTYQHDCAQDHIDAWPGRTRDFTTAGRTVRLSFTPCQHSPQTTRVLHIELKGEPLEEIQRACGLTIPSFAELSSAPRPPAPAVVQLQTPPQAAPQPLPRALSSSPDISQTPSSDTPELAGSEDL